MLSITHSLYSRAASLALALLLAASAQAQTPFSTPSRDIDNKGRNPFQSFSFATVQPNSTLTFSLADVPDNKRLVIDFISVGPSGGCLVNSRLNLEGFANGQRFLFTSVPNSDAGFSMPVTMYTFPGQRLQLQLNNTCSTGAARSVLVTGHFVNLP